MYSEEILKVFIYAVALVFKANRVNMMFSEKKKHLILCMEPMFFELKPPIPQSNNSKQL